MLMSIVERFEKSIPLCRLICTNSNHKYLSVYGFYDLRAYKKISFFCGPKHSMFEGYL